MQGKHVPPAASLTAFNCPHCDALAQQFWCSVHADRLHNDALPFLPGDAALEYEVLGGIQNADAQKERDRMEVIMKGLPFIEQNSEYITYNIGNIWISWCFNCNGIAIWIADNILWPEETDAPIANPDLSDDIRRDYDEAGAILNRSPRGAAALLRLAIQKLCMELGGKGKSIDADIGLLVKGGLPVPIQQALDIVRVIGNNAVHPGQLDLRDDRATAAHLFGLVNLIVDAMITQPKRIADMFAKLPQGARDGIQKRDGSTP